VKRIWSPERLWFRESHPKLIFRVGSCLSARKSGVSIVKESMENRGAKYGVKESGFDRYCGLAN